MERGELLVQLIFLLFLAICYGGSRRYHAIFCTFQFLDLEWWYSAILVCMQDFIVIGIIRLYCVFINFLNTVIIESRFATYTLIWVVEQLS